MRAVPRCLPLCCLLLLAAAGCVRQTPITGRRQLLLMPESQEISMGAAAYEETLKNEQPSTNPQYVQMVNRVGRRIAAATGVTDYDWEFRVIGSPVQNAFCLPGGKVAVYEGIMPICQTEAGLAVVMSHEIAHAVARHGGERMSQGFIVDGAKRTVAWVTRDLEETNREIVMRAYGAGSQLGYVLPYSRKHESEADAMGLVYMAKAGYDPSEAPRFWQRFAAATAGAEKQSEFLSTHPSDERRSKDLQQQLPAALALYQAAPARYALGEVIRPGGVMAPQGAQIAGPGAVPGQALAPAAAPAPAAAAPAGDASQAANGVLPAGGVAPVANPPANGPPGGPPRQVWPAPVPGSMPYPTTPQ